MALTPVRSVRTHSGFLSRMVGGLVLGLLPCLNAWAFTQSLTVSPNPARVGEEVTFRWPAGIATYCGLFINNVNSGLPTIPCASGELKYTPTSVGTASYTLMDYSFYSTSNAVVLTVEEANDSLPKISALTLNPASIVLQGNSTLSWSAENATSCTASGNDSAWSGSKSATGGTQTLQPTAAGTYEYELTCQNGEGSVSRSVSLTVTGAPVFGSFTGTPTLLTQEQSFTLSGSVTDATSCRIEGTGPGMVPGTGSLTLSGAGSQRTFRKTVSTSISTVAGSYQYQTVCEGQGGSTTSSPLTVTIDPRPAEPLITLSNPRFEKLSYLSDFYQGSIVLVADGSNLRSGVQCRATITRPDGTSYTATGSGSSGNRMTVNANQPGLWRAESFYCINRDGIESDRLGPVQADVNGQISIVSFGLADGLESLPAGTTGRLVWQANHAASCEIRDVTSGSVTSGLPASGSHEVSYSAMGQFNQELTCYSSVTSNGMPLSAKQTYALKFTTPAYQHGQVSGQWLGQYHFFMKLQQALGVLPNIYGDVCPMGDDGFRLCSDSYADNYWGIGTNIEPAWWLWDFDKGEIWMGSSTAMAMAGYFPYRLYDPTRVADNRLLAPEARPELWQMVGTFAPEPDSTNVYHAKFNLQIFGGGFMGRPLANLALRMGFANNGDGTLDMGTLKGHPDDKDSSHYFKDPYQVWEEYGAGGGYSRRVDPSVFVNQPGVVLPNTMDKADEALTVQAYNTGFPFRVTPIFETPRLSKVDPNEVCESDGWPVEFYRQFLRLSGDAETVCAAIPRNTSGRLDSDGDGLADMEEIGPNPVMPVRADSLFDFLQPKEFFRKPYFAGTIPLGNGERVVLYTKHDEEDVGQELGNRLASVPSAIWEPVPNFLLGQVDKIFPGANKEPWRLPATTAISGGTGRLAWELGSLRLVGINSNEQRTKTYYLYFNQGIPQWGNWAATGAVDLALYDIGLTTAGSNPYTWNAEDHRITYERLPDGHTIRFTLPQVRNSAPAHIAIGWTFSAAYYQPPASLRTSVAFDPQEPAYVALLESASMQEYVAEPSGIVWSFSKTPNRTAFNVGETVNIGWIANNTDQCRLELIGPSGVSLDAEWKSAYNGSQSYTFEQAGEHIFYLICDPGLAGEPQTITLTAFWGDDRDNTDPSVGVKPEGGGGAAGLPLLMLLGVAGWVRRQRGKARQAVRPLLAMSALTAALAVAPAHAAQGTPGMAGIYEGQYRISIHGCPGVCGAATAIVLGIGDKSVRWYFDFSGLPGQGPYAELSSTTLYPVGFPYEVQDVGNASLEHNRADLVDNGDGTYTLNHGFQVFNPQYDNPRAETSTLLRITQHENGRDLIIETLDSDGDGVPGKQIDGVFPMTVQPEFVGSLTRYPADNNQDGISDYDAMQLGLNPYVLDTDGDGVNDRPELEILPGIVMLTRPKDTDSDGVIDALEPGDWKDTAEVAGRLPLLGGVVGHKTTEDRLSGETVSLFTGSQVSGTTAVAGQDWYFHNHFYPRIGSSTGGNFYSGVMTTGPMVIKGNPAANPESGKSAYGAPGLPYEHGYTRFTALPLGYAPEEVSASSCGDGTPSAPTGVPENITLRLEYSAPLPARDKLLVYAEAFGNPYLTEMPTDFVLLDASTWSRVDEHTLEVSLPFDSKFNLASLYLNTRTCAAIGNNRYIKTQVGHAFVAAIAPTENTVGGVDSSRSLAVSGGSLGGGALVLLMLAGLVRRRK